MSKQKLELCALELEISFLELEISFKYDALTSQTQTSQRNRSRCWSYSQGHFPIAVIVWVLSLLMLHVCAY